MQLIEMQKMKIDLTPVGLRELADAMERLPGRRPAMIDPAVYRIIQQREYTPEEIRNVAN